MVQIMRPVNHLEPYLFFNLCRYTVLTAHRPHTKIGNRRGHAVFVVGGGCGRCDGADDRLSHCAHHTRRRGFYIVDVEFFFVHACKQYFFKHIGKALFAQNALGFHLRVNRLCHKSIRQLRAG